MQEKPVPEIEADQVLRKASGAGLTPMQAVSSVRDRLTPEATVVVSGLEGLGHVGLQIVLATTASRVVALDTDQAKIEYASEQGAIGMKSDGAAAGKIREMTGGIGADVVLDSVCVQLTVDIATEVERYSLDNAVRAFEDLANGRIQGRAVLVP